MGLCRSLKTVVRKPGKEPEKERPPWRSAVATQISKANKSALLKAKILDASRRALLAQKRCHVAVQTKTSAKLMWEKGTDVQKDLIAMIDRAVETDGSVSFRKDIPGRCAFFSILFASKENNNIDIFSYYHTNRGSYDGRRSIYRCLYTDGIT